MDSLAEFLVAALRFIADWPKYRDDLREASPQRRVVIAVLLLMVLCAGAGCLMMAQLSENRDLLPVFTDMFDPEGLEIYLKPIGEYVQTGRPVNFYTVAQAALNRNETALGYRLMSESSNADKAYGVHVNPKKSEKVTFAPEDKVIVFAES